MEAAKIANLSNGEDSPLTAFQQAAIDQAQKDLEDLRKELDTKKYLVDVDTKDIEMLKSFIANDATWKFTESLGIKEVQKELNDLKDGKLFTKALAIEAIYYYMSKVEGAGEKPNTVAFPNIDDYLRCLKAITNAVERIKADSEKIREAEFILAARQEGIDVDSSDNSEEV
jgi:hypothetical protein